MTIDNPTRALDVKTIGFWAIMIGSAVGLWLTIRSQVPLARAFPEAAVSGAVGLVLSLALGLWLIRRLLRPVEAPAWSGSWLSLAWGGLAACGGVASMNSMLMAVWSRSLDWDVAASWSAALTAPINEEIIKIVGVILLAAASTKFIRGPVDGFVYGALVGFGFQVAENFSYVFIQVIATGAIDPAASAGQSQALRIIATGAGSHWAMTAVAGAGIGYLVASTARPFGRRVSVAAGALLLAMAMHWQFDAPIMGDVGIIVQPLLNLIVAIVVFLFVRKAFRTRWELMVADEITTGSISPEEARRLSRRRGRARSIKAESAERRDALATIQRAQLALVEERVAGLTATSAEPWRRNVSTARERFSTERIEDLAPRS